MGNIRILIPDILDAQAAKVAAASVASSSLAAANMLTPEPWQKWRSYSAHPGVGVHPNETRFSTYISGVPLSPINGVALAGLNMTPGNGEILAVLAPSTVLTPPFQTLAPSAIADSNAITGAIGDVNEAVNGASDAAYIKPTHATDSFVTFDFGTPSASPRTGARRQCFVLKVAAKFDTTGLLSSARPTMTVKLYEDVSGTPTFRATLGTKTVHGTNAHLLFFSWDASLLATADGSNVQVRVEFTQEAFTGTDAWLDAIEWHCESTQLTGSSAIAESGWQAILPEPVSGVGFDYSTQLAESYTRWSYKFDQVYNAAIAYIFMREDHVPAETTTLRNRFLLPAPPGYVEVGKVVMGLWWSPAINRAQGQFVTVEDMSQRFDDDAAGDWGSREEVRDGFKIQLGWLTEAEMAWLNQRLLHELGTTVPFYLELEPDATFELGFGGWVTLASTAVQISRRNSDTYLYSMEFTVRVKR